MYVFKYANTCQKLTQQNPNRTVIILILKTMVASAIFIQEGNLVKLITLFNAAERISIR